MRANKNFVIALDGDKNIEIPLTPYVGHNTREINTARGRIGSVFVVGSLLQCTHATNELTHTPILKLGLFGPIVDRIGKHIFGFE